MTLNNKVLIKLFMPELNQKFDLFIPVNEVVWKIKKLIIASIQDLCDCDLTSNNYLLYNLKKNKEYKNNEIIINTDIRNASELVLIQKK